METEKCTCPKTIGQAKIKYGDLDEDTLATKLKKERVHDMDAFKEIIKNFSGLLQKDSLLPRKFCGLPEDYSWCKGEFPERHG